MARPSLLKVGEGERLYGATMNEYTSQEDAASRRGLWQRMRSEKLSRGEKMLGVLLLAVFLFVFYVALDANKYSAQVRAIEGQGRVGVNPTGEKLDFGDLSPGTAAVRTVTLSNQTFFPVYVAVVRFGDISSLTKLNENNFTLRPRDTKKLEFTVFMPASAEKGKTYSGRVYIFKIPKPW